MLYRRLSQRQTICVLSVHTNVLDLNGVVVTDMNAASKYVRFGAGNAGLAIVDEEKTFAESWKHPDDQIEEWRHSAMKCAEVLVPHCVDPAMVMRAYVCNATTKEQLECAAPSLAVDVNQHLFFNYS